MPIDLLAPQESGQSQASQPVDLLAGVTDKQKETGFFSNPVINAIVSAGEVAPNFLSHILKKTGHESSLYGDVKLTDPKKTSTKIGKVLGAIADMGVATEAAPAILDSVAPALADSLDALSAKIPLMKAAGVSKGLIPRAVASSGIMAGQAKKGEAKRQALVGLGLSPVAELGGAYAPALIKGVAKWPKNLFKKLITGPLSPFHRAMAPIFHNDLEDITKELSHGVSSQDVESEIFKRDKRHYDELLGNIPKPTGKEGDEKYLYVNPEDSTRDMYETARKHGANTPLNPEKFKKYINNKIDDLADEASITGEDTEAGKKIKSQLDTLADFERYVDNAKTLNKGAIVKKILTGKQSDAWNANDKETYGLAKGAKEALRDSFKDSAEKSPFADKLLAADKKYSEIKDLFDTVRGKKSPFSINYRENIGKSEPDVSKYNSGYIKGNVKEDDWQTIDKFMKMSPDQTTKDLKAYNHIKTAAGNPKEFMGLYSKLGEGQRKTLFPRHFEVLNQYATLFKKFPSLFPAKKSEASWFKGVIGAALGGTAAMAAGTGHLGVAAIEASPLAIEGIGRLLAKLPGMRNIYKSAVLHAAEKSLMTKAEKKAAKVPVKYANQHMIKLIANMLRAHHANKE